MSAAILRIIFLSTTILIKSCDARTGSGHEILLPTFSDLLRHYPAPARFRPHYRGGISNQQLLKKTNLRKVQNIENLRLSWALNQIGGKHKILPPKMQVITSANETILLPRYAIEHDAKTGLNFVLHDFEMGPYLTFTYGRPFEQWVSAFTTPETLQSSLIDKKGVIRFIMKHGRQAHIGLWLCKDVRFTDDQFYNPKMERVEFWAITNEVCN